jgi:hypothetical protein
MFSARYAGAVLVLDSRTISGVSNGGTLSSWVEKSANGRTFTAITGKRPTFQTSIQGGQPAVSFSATANSGVGTCMTTSITTAENPTQYVWICTNVPRNVGSDKHLVSTDDGSFSIINFSYVHFGGSFSGTSTRFFSTNTYNVWIFSATAGTPYINSVGYNGSTIYGFRTNVSQSAPVIGTTTTRISLGGRLSGSDLDTSDLMQFLLFNSFISKSLRRRFEVAASLSFKIADINNTATL